MTGIAATVTASSLLFGFLFAAFWWALNRELRFKPELRHFKYAHALLLITMAIVAAGGILRPLFKAAQTDAVVATAIPGIVVAFIGVFGYMLTEWGHYSIFQRHKYATPSERIIFWLTIAAMIGTWSLRSYLA